MQTHCDEPSIVKSGPQNGAVTSALLSALKPESRTPTPAASPSKSLRSLGLIGSALEFENARTGFTPLPVVETMKRYHASAFSDELGEPDK